MQRVKALGAAVALALLAPEALAVSTGASAQAAAWLKAHGQPQQDELAELKAENPSAYAIVKALLTKRSLGLLDPRHPSPSFAAPPPKADDVPGAEAFEKIAQESGEKPAAPMAYPDAPAAPAHHDWFSWKPPSSAADDAAAAAVGVAPAPEAPAAPAAPAATTAPAAPAEEAAAPVQAASQENSYLKGLDLLGDKPSPRHAGQSLAAQDSHDYLAGFSWDDDDKPKARAAPRAAVAAEAAAPAEAAVAAPAQAGGAPKNALLAWLGGGQGSKGASFLGAAGVAA